MSKLFDDMSRIEKLDHIQKCMDDSYEEIVDLTYLADILDVWDYWVPYLLDRLRELEGKDE